MKWNIQLGFALVTLSSFLLRQTACGQEEAEHEALRKLKAVYEEAINSNDLAKMLPHLGQNVSGVMLTGEEVKGFQDIQAYWDKIKRMMGEGGRYEVKLNPNRSELFGDIALAHGSTEDVVRANTGKTYRFGSHWTAVCRKENGQWKILRMQGTMDPIGNPFVNARVQFNRVIWGLGGLITGAVLVMLVGLFRRKKPS